MNKTANYSLTIVIPVYNEEDNIKRLQEVVGAYLPACHTAEKAASVLLRRTTGNSRGIKLLRVPAERPIYSSLHYPDNEGPIPKSSSLSSYCIFDAGVHPPQIS